MLSKTIELAKPDFSINLNTPIPSLQRRNPITRGNYVAKTMFRCLFEVKLICHVISNNHLGF